MAYLNAKSPMESKRVSFLSVFSSLMQSHPQCNTEDIDKFIAEAFRIVDKIWVAFPDAVVTDNVGSAFPTPDDHKCPKCGLDMKWVKPGISKKTQKPYKGFWSCDAQKGGCGFTQNLPTGP